MKFSDPRLDRKALMTSIRAQNTKPEMLVRRYLHSRGLRYVTCDRRLPGKPDIVFTRSKIAIFVHGCFWHAHEGCGAWKMPRTRQEYWIPKLAKNVARDRRNVRTLRRLGWSVHVVWECAISEKQLERIHRSVLQRKT